MAENSSIEWTDATWNPIAGCSMVSPGCTNCYAMRLAGRLSRMGSAKYHGTVRTSGGREVWTGRIAVDEAALSVPLKWRRPRRIFVNSMSDLFHEAVSDDVIARVWEVMAKADRHVFQILTKRPERMSNVLQNLHHPVLPNVWLGTSVEANDYRYRIDYLRNIPAAIRFVSFEPLIGALGSVDFSGISWAIVGGESGPGARPLQHHWVEALRESCERQNVAFFFKQWGGVQKHRAGRLLDGRTYDDLPAMHS